MKDREWIVLGTATQVHGIKGEFTFNLPSGDETILEDGEEVLLVPTSKKSKLPTEGKIFVIEKIRSGQKCIVLLNGIYDRTVAEGMLPFEIKFPRDMFDDELSENEFYLVDLVGLEVYDAKNKELHLGRVLDFYETAAQTVLVLTINNEKIDLPFIENFFPEVDVENKRIYINPPLYEDT